MTTQEKLLHGAVPKLYSTCFGNGNWNWAEKMLNATAGGGNMSTPPTDFCTPMFEGLGLRVQELQWYGFHGARFPPFTASAILEFPSEYVQAWLFVSFLGLCATLNLKPQTSFILKATGGGITNQMMRLQPKLQEVGLSVLDVRSRFEG